MWPFGRRGSKSSDRGAAPERVTRIDLPDGASVAGQLSALREIGLQLRQGVDAEEIQLLQDRTTPRPAPFRLLLLGAGGPLDRPVRQLVVGTPTTGAAVTAQTLTERVRGFVDCLEDALGATGYVTGVEATWEGDEGAVTITAGQTPLTVPVTGDDLSPAFDGILDHLLPPGIIAIPLIRPEHLPSTPGATVSAYRRLLVPEEHGRSARALALRLSQVPGRGPDDAAPPAGAPVAGTPAGSGTEPGPESAGPTSEHSPGGSDPAGSDPTGADSADSGSAGPDPAGSDPAGAGAADSGSAAPDSAGSGSAEAQQRTTGESPGPTPEPTSAVTAPTGDAPTAATLTGTTAEGAASPAASSAPPPATADDDSSGTDRLAPAPDPAAPRRARAAGTPAAGPRPSVAARRKVSALVEAGLLMDPRLSLDQVAGAVVPKKDPADWDPYLDVVVEHPVRGSIPAWTNLYRFPPEDTMADSEEDWISAVGDIARTAGTWTDLSAVHVVYESTGDAPQGVDLTLDGRTVRVEADVWGAFLDLVGLARLCEVLTPDGRTTVHLPNHAAWVAPERAEALSALIGAY